MKSTDESKGWRERLRPEQAKVILPLLSLAFGILAAVVLHYLLYRVGLPSKPFIYVAF